MANKPTIESKPYVIGIDLGGTNTAFGIVDARGNILRTSSIKTGKHLDINDYIKDLGTAIRDLVEIDLTMDKIFGIGIGAPNGNYFNGSIEFAPNLPWKDKIPLAGLLEKELQIPVVLTNDANAAAIGEMTYGAARGMKDFIEITLGTGVGSGIVVGGELVYGHDGFAGEVGHTVIRRNGRTCGCGRQGCLETYTAREYLSIREDDSLLRDLDPAEITSKDVFDAAMKGDKLAIQIFENTGTILGEALADAVAYTSPEAIILFGGLTHAGDLLLKPTQRAMEENLLNIYKGKVKIVFSELKENDAAIPGAAAMGWEATALHPDSVYMNTAEL